MRVGIDCHFESKIKQGTNTYVSELVKAISRNDCDNDYFLLNANYNNTFYNNTSKNIIKKKTATNSTRKNILYGYRKEAQRNRLDILHTNYLCPFFLPCKSVVTIHDILYTSHEQYFPTSHTFQLKVLTPLTVRFADRIIAVSEYTKAQIVSRFGIEESKIGVTLEAGPPAFRLLSNGETVRNEVKSKYRIDNDFILYVGRLAPIKNLPRMLNAFTEYNRKTDKKISFVLVGSLDPVYPDKEIEGLIAQLSFNYNIRILNEISQDDLVMLYNSALCFLFVSLGEGFGLPILEAMGCGTPVITSNVTSCPEVAGSAGITVDPYNDKEIYESLSGVLSSPELREQMKKDGLKRSSFFSWDRCCRETIEQYKLCL